MITALHNIQLITNGEMIAGKAVLIEGSQIKAVINETEIPADATQIDLKGNFLAPGLIDLQIYGSGGKLFGGKPEVDALAQMESDLVKQGTTGFFATIATNSNEIVEQGIASAKAYRKESTGNFWGLHLEGPYLNAKRKGAHPEKFIKKAILSELKGWVDSAEGEIKMITIAPELQDADVLEYLAGQDIVVSSGHSNATYAEAKQFIHHPVKAITHLYNAMPQMHHREPGIIPAIFEEQPYTSVVADGIHVNFTMISLAKRMLGDKLFLITDAVTATDEGVYQHQFSGNSYTMPDGTLSGSALMMLKAVENCLSYCGISLAEAVNMASLYPAQLASMPLKGRIADGCDADLLSFNADFEIQATWLKGKQY